MVQKINGLVVAIWNTNQDYKKKTANKKFKQNWKRRINFTVLIVNCGYPRDVQNIETIVKNVKKFCNLNNSFIFDACGVSPVNKLNSNLRQKGNFFIIKVFIIQDKINNYTTNKINN